ncbi:Pathogenesis-related protein 1C [Bienertia sinuspersici]
MKLGKKLAWSIIVTLTIISIAKTLSCHAQYSPEDYLNPHNVARAAVGVPNIQWSDKLAAYAQHHADACIFRYSGGPYGENLAMTVGTTEMTAARAVELWVSEKQNYNYEQNTCGCGYQCGHYTQVVWNTSLELGCGMKQCNPTNVIDLIYRTIIVCSYNPRGNWVGHRPY